MTLYVLDSTKDAIFAYDLESGELAAEYALDSLNGNARGIWSDRVTLWVSDHGAKRLFAYRRLSTRPTSLARSDHRSRKS